ncbi:MAG: esterase-like activity of phytase family protein [Alcanivoracaceae bacterium]|nr:esterase-like activity of phytase family protein [Alcanivoracaceae bacterium]
MLKLWIVLLVSILLSACNNHQTVNYLKLIKAYEVMTNGTLEPSGLTLWDGEFYTISDKQNKIYHLQFEQDKVRLKPIINIVNNRNTKLDFEGLSHDDKYFYLISEKYFQILKVSKDGSEQVWLPINDELQQAGIDAGLFQTHNANFEGICFLEKNKFLLVAEREPRGFIEVLFDDSKIETIRAYSANDSRFPSAKHRSTDFTGLSCDDDIYVLERNAYVVAKLKKQQGKFKESVAWSYQHIIEKPEYQYQDMKYGHAEGLVVSGDKVYIILDNNRGAHNNNANDNNSWFFELKK